jgi:hypothetical protein
MQLFKCFSDLRFLGSYPQESLCCPGYAKAAIAQILEGKVERESLMGTVGPITQDPLSQAPDDCHAGRALRNPLVLVRVGKPEAKTVPALNDPLLAARSPYLPDNSG